MGISLFFINTNPKRAPSRLICEYKMWEVHMKKICVVAMMLCLCLGCALAQGETVAKPIDTPRIQAMRESGEIKRIVGIWMENRIKEMEALPPFGSVISHEQAMEIALETILVDLIDLEAAHFEPHKAIARYTETDNWVLSVLPEADQVDTHWIAFLTIDATSGEVLEYRAMPPREIPPEFLTDEPKG